LAPYSFMSMSLEELSKEYVKLLSEDKFQEALEVSRKVIASNPKEPHYWYNHAMIAQTLGNYQETADSMSKAKELLPECPVIRRLLSDSLFQLGRYREALTEKEYRFQMPIADSPSPAAPMPVWIDVLARFRASYPQPDWDGESDLKNKTILIFNEAGHGDMIQHLRYLPMVKEHGAKVIVEAKPELIRLVKTAKGIDEICVHEKADKVNSFFTNFTNLGQQKCKTPPADYAMSCQSLPYYFDRDLTKIPMTFPYLFPTPTPDNKAVEIVESYKNKFKVGIAWAGNWKDYCDKYRSCFLREFKPLTELEGVQVFGLQKKTDLGKMKRSWWQERGPSLKVNLLEGSEGMNFVDLDPYLDDFHTTAEVIQKLDLLVTVDTAVAHLAGALDRPVWMIASHLHHEWRWDVKWYNSLRLFRQKVFGDWTGLMAEVVQELRSEFLTKSA
jgi:hypothetical protein